MKQKIQKCLSQKILDFMKNKNKYQRYALNAHKSLKNLDLTK